MIFFSHDSESNEYQAQFGSLTTLHADGNYLILTDPNGTRLKFHNFSDSVRPGGFVELTSPGGNQLTVTEVDGDRIAKSQRSTSVNGQTVTDIFSYVYGTSGGDANRLLACTLSRKIGTDPEFPIERAVYTYYGDDSPFGSSGDLESVTRQLPSEELPTSSSSSSSESSPSGWLDTATDYYRYHKGSSSKGNAHDLKFVCKPTTFKNMQADSLDPFTVSNAVLAEYADNYYEYDFNDRVVLERVNGGSMTMSFAYEENPEQPPCDSSSSCEANDPNFWVFKTTESLPDGSQKVVYANFAGQTMLSVLKNAATPPDSSSSSSSSSTAVETVEEWLKFKRYDERGRVILAATPAAITGFDEDYGDLLGYDELSGTFEYLRDNSGLLYLTEFYLPVESPPADYPEGYIKSRSIQEGQLGTPVPQEAWEYTAHTYGTDTVFHVSKSIQYPDDNNFSTTIETSYAYTFHSGTTQVKEIITTLPVISTSQNGSGTANTHKEYFDELGYLTWSMNERGFITHYLYDTALGAMIQQIEDVDTSITPGAPAGWSTPAEGGLNIITDYENDDRGRPVQVLGPVHAVDLNGVSTPVRRADWTVYDDATHTTTSAQGFATGTAPNYTFTLVNPVNIQISNPDGNPLQVIQAVRDSTSGKLLPTDTFPQASYTRWHTYEYTTCCQLHLERVYFDIPTTGVGLKSVNYAETSYRYDEMKRRIATISPGGTISRVVYGPRGLVLSNWVGTNDTGATPTDPTGGGATGNNMVVVSANQYDGGQPGGNGNLTQQTQHVDASTTRVTEFSYDFRNRRLTTDGEVDYFEKSDYDNLNRVIKTERYDTDENGNLLARSETKYDNLSRVYQEIQYGVDPATGTVGNSLVNNTWYDESGNVIKTQEAGARSWTKTTFDSLNRSIDQYQGYGTDSSYADLFSVTGDVILQQTETVYDDASNTLEVIHKQRYHNAADSQTGALGDPSTSPKARVTYDANYSDPVGRTTDTASYGTNGGAAWTRSATVPARSDTILIQSQRFDAAGNLLETIDPAGMVNRFEYDDQGRQRKIIENFMVVSSTSASETSSETSNSSEEGCPGSDDTNRTTQMTYTPEGQLATLTAINAATGNQVTTYTYGTTLADSDIASNSLLRQVAYPDSSSSDDVVTYTYNRQSERTGQTDQNGNVRQFEYDLLGRQTQDRVVTLGAGVDAAVRRIETAYDVRGLVARISSYDQAMVGTGSVVNEVRSAYNDFAQPITSWQAHSGAVDTMSTPKVQYEYADGSDNSIRPTAILYPNGRQLDYEYGSANGIDDSLSRVAAIIDESSSVNLAQYQYLGSTAVVRIDSPQADLQYTLVDLTDTNDPDTGDIYSGLDRFGRVKDVRWHNTDTAADLSRVQYGYNRASNRIWRKNPTDPNEQYDWLYTYDGLQRLKDAQRGTLNAPRTALSSQDFAQCWSLDATGNWQQFRQADAGSSWSLEQQRTANPVNEITGIENSVGPAWAQPAYDANGNMTTIPHPTGGQSLASSSSSSSSEEIPAGFTATYDAWNRLIKLTDAKTAATVQENQYDGRYFRTLRKDYVEGTLDQTRHFYYTDAWRCVEERLDTSTTPDRHFVWGVRYIDDLICRDRSTTGTLNERLYALPDGNWNVTALVNTSGSVTERLEYDPYGNTTWLTAGFVVEDGSQFGWEVTYCGYRWDDAVSMFQVRFRWYLATIGSWTTRDPAGYRDGMNCFLYSCAMPLRYGDAYGLTPLGAKIASMYTWRGMFGLTGVNHFLHNDEGTWVDTSGEMLECTETTRDKWFDKFLKDKTKFCDGNKHKIWVSGERVRKYGIAPVMTSKGISSAGWWLNEAHELEVNGFIEVKCCCKRTSYGCSCAFDVISTNLWWNWKDAIDANPSYNTDNPIKATAEYAVLIVGDGILDANFNLAILFNQTEPPLRTFYSESKCNKDIPTGFCK